MLAGQLPREGPLLRRDAVCETAEATGQTSGRANGEIKRRELLGANVLLTLSIYMRPYHYLVRSPTYERLRF